MAERVRDWHEVYLPFPRRSLVVQATRCMDCGIPFCHEGCPLGNLIPEWNDLVRRERFAEAAERLHATNNFPELTGRLCPAPCEGACVLGISSDPVLIKQVEHELAEWAAGEGLEPVPPSPSTGRNFGAGMSGGVAYVYDPDDRFAGLCNTELVDLEPLTPDDHVWLKDRLTLHERATGSAVAARVLGDWDATTSVMVKVMPRDYRRVLQATERAVAQGRPIDEVVMEASRG